MCVMIRLAILLLLSVYAIGTLDAQSWSEVTRSKAYIWGQGYGSTPEEADDNAVKALVEKISMQVVIDSKLVLTEGNDRYSNVMNTYSAATLPNLQKLTLKNDFKNDVYEVGCWILAKDMDKIFDGRRAKITTMLESASVPRSVAKWSMP